MRFIVLSGTHFTMEKDVVNGIWWNRTLYSHSEKAAGMITEAVNAVKPDFAVHCGDITNSAYGGDIELLDRVMKDTNVPWYAVPGNHDKITSRVAERFSALYSIPHGRCYYSRKLGCFHFIFLDTCCWEMEDGTHTVYLYKIIQSIVKPAQCVNILMNSGL